MGYTNRFVFAGLAIIFSTCLTAQRGAQDLSSLEWANFGTGTGQGYVIYTPTSTGEPEYYSLVSLLNSLNISENTDNQQIQAFTFNPSTKQFTLTIEDGGTQAVSLNSLEEKLQLVGDNISIVGDASFSLAKYYDNTDDQQIQAFTFNPSTKQFTLTIEDGGTQAVSLNSLEEKLQLVGDNISIVGDASFSLAKYYDNTDDQQITDFSISGTILSLTMEDGGTASVNIAQTELDPVFLASPAASITTADINNWNTDDVDDADSDPTNELDPVTYGQTQSHDVTVSGPRVQGGATVVQEYYLDSTIAAFGFGVESSDNQVLSFDDQTFTATLENGGSINLSVLNNSNMECFEEQVTGASVTFSELDIPADAAKRWFLINGVRMAERVTPSHPQHLIVNSTNETITLFKDLSGAYIVGCSADTE